MIGLRALTDGERLSWLRLARTPSIGPVTFAQLMTRYGDAARVIEALPDLVRKTSRAGGAQVPSADAIEAEIEATRKFGARIIAACEADFPPLLRAMSPPPPVLTVLGHADFAARTVVAMVGARDASAAGRKIARDMAAALGAAGYVTASGLALGIDGEVHAASLKTGTIAVLGGGIDHIYPPQHERLYASIAAEGLIVSESPFGHRAKAQDFPRRNRIITGMSSGCVVVEAAGRSGSLISARMAAEQGREVMAVPGSPLDPRAEGTNELLRTGATLVRNAADVLEVLSQLPLGGVQASKPFDFEPEPGGNAPPGDQIARVLEALSPFPVAIDEIARAAGVGPGRCAAILAELELAGDAGTVAGGLAFRRV